MRLAHMKIFHRVEHGASKVLNICFCITHDLIKYHYIYNICVLFLLLFLCGKNG